MVLNNNLDIISGDPHSVREINYFIDFLKLFNLYDCWRFFHTIEKDFSNPFIARRLDYILCSKLSKTFLKECNLVHFSSTDHKAVTARFKFDTFQRGPGRWLLNESLLEDTDFVVHMSRFISNQIESLQRENSQNKQLMWDLLKIGIKEESIAFSKIKKLKDREECDLELEIKQLTNELIIDPKNETLLNTFLSVQLKKEVKELSKSKGALIRARAKFIEVNEKNSKYFLGLEKSRQSNNIVRAVRDNRGAIVESPEKVMTVIKSFYEKLYDNPDNNDNSENTLETFLGDASHPILSQNERESCDQLVTLEELEAALKQLNPDSSPGHDGLTPAFYVIFWDQLKWLLYECYMESIEKESLALSQTRGVINLIHKGKGSDLLDLGNWRPITLTNTDYKIFTKLLAVRLQNVIKSIINENQVGYIKGRSISSHIRLIDDIINLSNIEDLPGLVVSLDYSKAFDTVSKISILKTLEKFNFGPVFLSYIKTILNNTEASIKNAGWLSEWFKTNRGVRQGCCVSPLLFILVVEMLANKIRSEEDIKGIFNNKCEKIEKESKLIQYADDMTLFLKDKECLKRSLDIIERFKEFSGLVLNRNQSVAMLIGSNKNKQEKGGNEMDKCRR